MLDRVEAVIAQFQHIVAADGGKIELLGVAEDIVSVRYSPGTNDQCADCVLTPEDLRELLLEAMRQRLPALRDLSLVTE
jgi:Fe-S cluster biogenesis protein NfuA